MLSIGTCKSLLPSTPRISAASCCCCAPALTRVGFRSSSSLNFSSRVLSRPVVFFRNLYTKALLRCYDATWLVRRASASIGRLRAAGSISPLALREGLCFANTVCFRSVKLRSYALHFRDRNKSPWLFLFSSSRVRECPNDCLTAWKPCLFGRPPIAGY